MKYNVPLPRVLDTNGNELRRLNVIDASVSLSLVPLSTAQIVLPLFETLNMREWVEMYTSQGSAGVFRVRSPGQNYRMESKQYALDHGIVELGDYIVNADLELSDSANNVIPAIFSCYTGSMWQLGTVAPTENVTYSDKYDDVLTALLSVMEQLPDYMMQFNQKTKPWTLNIVRKPQVVTGEGRLGRNIISARIAEDDSVLCTRIVSPDLPGGKLDADTISQYGVVERFFDKEDKEQTQEHFVEACQKYIAQHKNPLLSVNLELRDLEQITGETLDGIAVGDLYRLALPEYNITIEEPVVSLFWRSVYSDPGAVIVELAHEEMTMSSAFHSIVGAGGLDGSRSLSKINQKIIREEAKLRETDLKVVDAVEYLDEAWIEIEAQGVTIGQQQTTTDLLTERMTQAEATITVQHDQIQSKVSQQEFDTLGDRVSNAETSITQTAEAIRSEASVTSSALYSAIEQTASNIRATIVDTEDDLRSYIELTASALRERFIATSNRTWVQDNDPRTEQGGSYVPKVGDTWVESTHQGTWDGAEGFDWEHDEDYDWSKIQGAKVWVWQNNQWELAADRTQAVTYADVVSTAEHYLQQRIAGIVNDEGMLDVYMSKLEQTATEIRSEVHRADSEIYSAIAQTTSDINLSVGGRPTTIVQNGKTDGQPTVINGRDPTNNDIWIDTADQGSWDEALNYSWTEDNIYNWNDLRSDKIYVYKDGEWHLAQDGTVLAEDTDLQIDRNHISLLARNIDTLDGYARENFAELRVEANRIYSTVEDRTNELGSRIEQTATQIRSEVHSSKSELYSEIVQTSSNILLHVEDEVSRLGSSIEVTAEQIRSEVHSSESQLYSEIVQTSSNILLHVENEVSRLGSSIEVTSENIRSEVHAGESKIYTSIQQTASQIRSEVNNSVSDLRSQITQTANKIALVVDGNNNIKAAQIVASINNAGSSVLISADKINIDGWLQAKQVTVNGLYSKQNVWAPNGWINGKDIQIGGDSLSIAIVGFGDATESSGKITIPTTRFDGTAGPSINFNIADTQYYKNGVSAAEIQGKNSITAALIGTQTLPSGVTSGGVATPGWYYYARTSGRSTEVASKAVYVPAYNQVQYAKKGLTRESGQLYLEHDGSYYPVNSRYTYFYTTSGSGWDTLYEREE